MTERGGQTQAALGAALAQAATLGVVRAGGSHWVGIDVPVGATSSAVRVELLERGAARLLAVVAGGVLGSCANPADVLAWNAAVPPGAGFLWEGGRIWIRFLVPLDGLEGPRLRRVVSFVAEQGKRLQAAARIEPGPGACIHLFAGFT